MEIFTRQLKCICIIPLFGSSSPISSFIYLYIYKYIFCLVSLVPLTKAAANRKRKVSTSSKTRFFKYRIMICRHSKVVVKETPLCNLLSYETHPYCSLLSCIFPISFNPIRKTKQTRTNKQKTPCVLLC